VNILAIETSTDVCAVAMVRDGVVMKECSLHEKHVHSEKLLTLIEDVVESQSGYDAVAVSIGPGSFTGLRIGLSTAKGLIFASGARLIAVSTLACLAWRAREEGAGQVGDEVVAMVDARRNEVYAGGFRIEKESVADLWGPSALSLDEVFERVRSRKVALMGDGVGKFLDRFRGSFQENRWIVPDPLLRMCSAGAVGSLASRMAMQGRFSDAASIEPIYVKEFDAMVRAQLSSPQPQGIA
jgi:tRNA threonylcarbamoyladenosine biosynthesis protein TsaB